MNCSNIQYLQNVLNIAHQGCCEILFGFLASKQIPPGGLNDQVLLLMCLISKEHPLMNNYTAITKIIKPTKQLENIIS